MPYNRSTDSSSAFHNSSGGTTVAIEPYQVIDTAGNPVGAASHGSFLAGLNYTAYLPLVLR